MRNKTKKISVLMKNGTTVFPIMFKYLHEKYRDLQGLLNLSMAQNVWEKFCRKLRFCRK